MLSLDELRQEVGAGRIDTVVTAFTDMQGRLFGKRIQVEYFLDEVTESGIEGCNYLLALDMEIIPNRLFAGFNLLYVPEVLRTADFAWERATTLGASAALAYRFLPTLVLGAALEYFRHYESLNLTALEGDAFFVGPTLYWQVTRKSFIQAAWSAQIAGHAVGDPRALNLDEFSRYRAKLKYAYEF